MQPSPILFLTGDAADRQATFEARDLERRRVIVEANARRCRASSSTVPMRAQASAIASARSATSSPDAGGARRGPAYDRPHGRSRLESDLRRAPGGAPGARRSGRARGRRDRVGRARRRRGGRRQDAPHRRVLGALDRARPVRPPRCLHQPRRRGGIAVRPDRTGAPRPDPAARSGGHQRAPRRVDERARTDSSRSSDASSTSPARAGPNGRRPGVFEGLLTLFGRLAEQGPVMLDRGGPALGRPVDPRRPRLPRPEPGSRSRPDRGHLPFRRAPPSPPAAAVAGRDGAAAARHPPRASATGARRYPTPGGGDHRTGCRSGSHGHDRAARRGQSVLHRGAPRGGRDRARRISCPIRFGTCSWSGSMACRSSARR